MAKKTKIQEINLLPQEEFEASTIGRVLKWLLSTFRYIVISTEMVVMVAFLSRFWLDSRSADLTDAINQKKSIISSYSTFESNFRSVQQKLVTFNKFASTSQKASTLLQDISSRLPADVILTEITISDAKIQITAESGNENSASTFVSNLNSSSLLSSMALTSAESKQGSNTISFTINGIVKGGTPNGS